MTDKNVYDPNQSAGSMLSMSPPHAGKRFQAVGSYHPEMPYPLPSHSSRSSSLSWYLKISWEVLPKSLLLSVDLIFSISIGNGE